MVDRSAGLEWRSAETGRLVSGEGQGEGGALGFLAVHLRSMYVLHPGVVCMCVDYVSSWPASCSAFDHTVAEHVFLIAAGAAQHAVQAHNARTNKH